MRKVGSLWASTAVTPRDPALAKDLERSVLHPA